MDRFPDRIEFIKHFSFRFGGGGSSVKIPPAPPPAATPPAEDQDLQRADDLRRKLRSRKGRRGTILTEGTLGTEDAQKKSLLG